MASFFSRIQCVNWTSDDQVHIGFTMLEWGKYNIIACPKRWWFSDVPFDGLMQDCRNSECIAVQLLQCNIKQTLCEIGKRSSRPMPFIINTILSGDIQLHDLDVSECTHCKAVNSHHDGVRRTRTSCNTWWRHQMEKCSTLLAICVGNSPVAELWCFLWSASESAVE